VVIGGAELLTGNMALLPLAAFRGRVSPRDMFPNLGFVLFGKLLGALFVAFFLADQTGIASSELPLERLAFVAMGFDHVVANMFFLPAAIFAGVDLTWWDALHNWIFAFLGNFVGAAIFVAGAYWYLYARPEPGEPTAGGLTVSTEEPEAEPATPTQAPA
jgi:formate transporter